MAQISTRTARARAAMELKLSILSALNKLGDRDTQQMAVEELHRIAENLSPDTLSVFLASILDVGPEQKLPVRKECVRILSALATLHGEILSPHLSKIIGYVMRRLKDTDTQIRDVCVETMGSLVARVPVTENQQGGFLLVYTKPLFDAMVEQTKTVQVGAATCLGKVIESAPNVSPACVHKLAPRIAKVLSSPGFMAKAALLSAIGSLSRVVKDSGEENLIQLVPCVHEALQSNDWTARKAAAETLAVLASPGLSKEKPSTLGMLDSYRFDKVKPVRDAVTCAIQVWKTVPDPEADCSYKIKRMSSPSDEMPSFSRCWKEPDAEVDPAIADTGSGYEQSGSVASDDKGSSKGRRKAPTLSDMKPNPEFFRKLESKITDDWQVEVAVPRVSPSQGASAESEKDYVSAEATPGESGEADNSSRRSRTPLESEAMCLDAVSGPEVDVQISSLTIKASIEETASWLDEAREGRKEKHWGVAAGVAAGLNERGISGSDWMLIQRQICQLERGQTELLEMLQDFMCTCQENMLSLQDRVQRLEKSVETIEKASGRSSGGSRHLSAFEVSARNRMTGCDARDSDAFSSRPFRLSDYDERFSVHSDRSGRESPYGNQELLNGARRVSQNSNNSFLFGASRQQQVDEDADNQAPVARRAWDRGSGSGSVRHGEGPSARSVWRASKDEATLEAIRGAAGEELMAVTESEKAPEILLESKQVEHKQQPSWLFWSRAMENLHGGDVDSAYEEALSAEDDLLLVRMMNQTGPAFDHFSGSTALSMFRALIQILHQQHFLDAAFPWLEQAAELMKTKGPECFNLLADAKRELVSALHETSALDFPERWMGNAVAKLALQLATAWSIDLLHQGD